MTGEAVLLGRWGIVVLLVVGAGLGVGYWLTLTTPGVDESAEPVSEAGEPATATSEPADAVEPPTRGLGELATVKASRLFAGPDQFPPEDFAAYGIVAFRARATSSERDRHLMMCEAYSAVLPRSDELALPVDEQMVTVWPITDGEIAEELNQFGLPDVCERAISHYGLATALQALRDAGEERIDVDRRGPFLLAWAPATSKGQPDALMLVADLSTVTTASQAEAVFVHWRNDIEANPEYWDDGWDVEQLRLAIQHWVDRFGSQIFTVLGE